MSLSSRSRTSSYSQNSRPPRSNSRGRSNSHSRSRTRSQDIVGGGNRYDNRSGSRKRVLSSSSSSSLRSLENDAEVVGRDDSKDIENYDDLLDQDVEVFTRAHDKLANFIRHNLGSSVRTVDVIDKENDLLKQGYCRANHPDIVSAYPNRIYMLDIQAQQHLANMVLHTVLGYNNKKINLIH